MSEFDEEEEEDQLSSDTKYYTAAHSYSKVGSSFKKPDSGTKALKDVWKC